MSSTEIFDFDDSGVERVPSFLDGAPDEDVPPAGTPCAGCRKMRHWCAAKCYRGEATALCLACANGIDCDVVTALRRAKQISESGEIVLDRFDHPPPPCRSIPVAPGMLPPKPAPAAARLPYTPDPEALRMPKREIQRERYARPLPQLPPVRIVGKPKELQEGEKAMRQVSAAIEELKNQIRNAPPGESAADLAKRLNVPVWKIYQYRDKKAAPAPTPKASTPKQATKPALAKAAPAKPSTAIDIVGVAERVHAMAPASAPEESITVSVTLTADGLEKWFSGLSLADKAKILLGNWL